jgi:type IV pilus assembly protein PilA
MNRKFSILDRRRDRSVPETVADRSSTVEQNGFTLMELLIVISIIVILMLIAIPTANTIKKHTDEVSAQKSLQTIEQAESMYSTNYPINGFACSLQALSGDPSSGPPSPTAAQLINGQITTGIKDGYIIAISNCTKVTVNNTDRITSYTVTAVPATPGKTGDRGFCIEAGGAMKADPAGGTNCTQMVQ